MTQTDINLPFITADATGAKHLQMTLTRWGSFPCYNDSDIMIVTS